MAHLPGVTLLTLFMAHCAGASVISGTVIEDHSGNAVVSAEVKVLRHGNTTLVADLETDGNGRFELPDVSDGDYRVEVSKANYVGVAVQAGAGTSFIVHLIRCGAISGHVLNAQGQAVHGATVFAMSRVAGRDPWRPFARSESGHEARVGDSGEYRLFNLPPGQYAIAVTYGASTTIVGSTGQSETGAEGSGVLYYPDSSRPRLFTVAGGEDYRDVDFSVMPSALYRVAGKIDGAEAKKGYWVALTSLSQPSLATAVTQAADDGAFHLEGIPAGSYTLFASGPSRARAISGMLPDEHVLFGRIPLEVGGNVEGLSVPVAKAKSAWFRLRNALPGNQACSAAIEMRLSALEDRAAYLDRTVTVGFGKLVHLDGLAPGRYMLTAGNSETDCTPVEEATIIDLSSGSEQAPIGINVAPKGSIHGRLTGGGDWEIVLKRGDAAARISLTDKQGHFSLRRYDPDVMKSGCGRPMTRHRAR